ncbi:MAG TPA: TonB-dependent receptor [Ignavibacteriaceae bacterium]|nr:TonB-dependent receptor [Ignavibacteriaceae bacterium]
MKRFLSINGHSRFMGVIFILFLFTSSGLSFEINSELTGFVIDSETSKPVANAVIQILNTELYTTSRENGSFQFLSIEENNYLIKVTHLSYQEKLMQIELGQDKTQNLVIYLVPRAINLSPVVVTGEVKPTLFDEINELSNVLKGKELQRDLSLTLASTLKNETGLAMRSMGPAPARPVMRGLGQNRVLISEDGTTTTDLSATSPDHAVTIEPFTVERIEVVRGPKVLLQTPTTIGGVVNVIRNEIPTEVHNQIHLNFGGYGETVNDGYLGSIVSEIPLDPFAFRFEFSKRQTDDLMTPVGELENSYSENLNYSVGTSFVKDWGFIGTSFRSFELEYGVPGGFVGAHPDGVDIELYRRQLNIKSPINFNDDFFKDLESNYSFVLYRHKEFESSGRIGAEFKIQTHLGNVNLNHNSLGFLSGGTFGVSFEFREYEVGGFVFNPPSNSFNISGYLFETFNLNRFHFEFSGRLNYDNIKPLEEKPDANIGYIRERQFNTFSLSVSSLYELTDIVFLGINLSKSSRVPTIEELFSEGPHLAAYSYEIGNPDLNAESGFGSEFFIYHKFEKLFFSINVFYNNLNNYIIPRNTGEINYATFLPIYATTGVGAEFYGIENQIDWKISRLFTLNNSISFTRGIFKSGGSLPQIPPLKGLLELIFNLEHISIGLGTEWAAEQNKVDQFEEPTAGYVIFNNYYQYLFQTGEAVHTISLSIDNILNQEYRNHLSRIKSILPEAGTNFRLSYRLFI